MMEIIKNENTGYAQPKCNNFIVMMCNKDKQMFVNTEEGLQPIDASPAEHIERLMLISENCHFFVDEATYAAFGSHVMPGRFTRVFCKDAVIEADATHTMFTRFHPIEDLHTIVGRAKYYAPDTVIFFIGQPDFLLQVAQYCESVLLTVTDTEKAEHSVDVPESLMYEFPKKHSIKPENFDTLKRIKDVSSKRNVPRHITTTAENGIIIKQENPDYSLVGKTLEQPLYWFYEMTR